MEVFKPLILEYIRYYYEDNPTGGNLHIALDDGNLEDDNLFFCQEECKKHGDTFGYFLATLMRHFNTEELEGMYYKDRWGMKNTQ